MEGFENKVVPTARWQEGDREIIAKTRDVEKTLHNEPGFVGVAPYGSRWKGHSSEDSDYDVIALYDSTIAGCDLEKMRQAVAIKNNASIDGEETKERQTEVTWWIDMAALKNPDFSDVGFLDVPYVLMEHVIGPKINEYRAMMRPILDAHPEGFKEIVDHATFREFQAFRRANWKEGAENRNVPPWKTYADQESHSSMRRPLFEKRARAVFFPKT